MKKSLLFFCLLVLCIDGFSQNTTIGDVERERMKGNTTKPSNTVLLIPFDPRLYLSEIDRKIGTENNMSFNQIRSAFRNGLDRQLMNNFKTSYPTYSLLTDTVETDQDLALIYKSLNYKYEPIPGENNLTAKQTPQGTKIKEGQLVVEMNYDKRFMNASVKNPNLLEYLTKKYKAGIFVFINELDFKNDMDAPMDLETNSYPRQATVHFTVLDKTGKELLSGISALIMSPKVNDPKAIVNTTLAYAAKDISSRVLAKLNPIVPPKTKPAIKK